MILGDVSHHIVKKVIPKEKRQEYEDSIDIEEKFRKESR